MLKNSVPSYFKARRDRLMAAHPRATFLFPGTSEVPRNPDVTFQYRQESFFYYLTGFDEPGAFLALTPGEGVTSKTYKTVLFTRRRDADKEMWVGERYGIDRARVIFGVDEVYPIDELDQRMPALFQGADEVFYRMHNETLWGSDKMDARVLAALEGHRRSQGRSGGALLSISDPNQVVGEMRLFKGPEEIDLMRKACQATALAYNSVMRETHPGMNEADIEAMIEYYFRKNGCRRIGYGTIIAGGKNATCLHYVSNNEELKDNELLLIDAGGEYDYYSADITRTFPIGKKFSKPQAAVYDVVLKAQLGAVEMSRPGVALADIHKYVCETLTDGLLSLGLLKGDSEEILKSGGFRRFYPHNTSHWLGMDVHDVGFYQKDGKPRVLEPGMVFTIEPGFYVQPHDNECPTEYQGIGIRIEDDILITANGHENLTRDVPKTREAIEALKA